MPVLQHVISSQPSHASAFKTSISCRMTCAETSFLTLRRHDPQNLAPSALRCALSRLARASCPAQQLHGCSGQQPGQARRTSFCTMWETLQRIDTVAFGSLVAGVRLTQLVCCPVACPAVLLPYGQRGRLWEALAAALLTSTVSFLLPMMVACQVRAVHCSCSSWWGKGVLVWAAELYYVWRIQGVLHICPTVMHNVAE
jgi:hypothetical protein